MPPRIFFLLTGLCGSSAVGLGAFGAHGLRGRLLELGTTEIWRTAASYHLAHAVALLAIAGVSALVEPARAGWQRWLRMAGLAWLAGIILFSGSLYWLALGGPRWLGPVTPIGGLAFLTGWAAVIAAGANLGDRSRSQP